MLTAGLCSVTFRKLSAREVIGAVRRAGLGSIEWGGDVHVPPGNTEVAREVRAATEGEGLVVASYGSYYRAGVSAASEFDAVLASAGAVGAPMIRVWAGNRGSAKVTRAERELIMDDLRRVTALAAAAGVTVATEHHDNTLTDEQGSTEALLADVAGLKTYWQPPHRMTPAERLESLRRLLPRVTHLHVFHWVAKEGGGHDFRPLGEGSSDWKKYLDLRAAAGSGHVLMEFVREESVEQLNADARVLMELLQ